MNRNRTAGAAGPLVLKSGGPIFPSYFLLFDLPSLHPQILLFTTNVTTHFTITINLTTNHYHYSPDPRTTFSVPKINTAGVVHTFNF